MTPKERELARKLADALRSLSPQATIRGQSLQIASRGKIATARNANQRSRSSVARFR